MPTHHLLAGTLPAVQNDCHVDNPFKGFAKSVFLRRFGVPPSDLRWNRPGLYHAKTWGSLGRRVQYIQLDTRWFRSAFVPTDCRGCPGRERYLPYNSSDATMLGDAQWLWLEQQLRLPADLRLIFSTVQVCSRCRSELNAGEVYVQVSRCRYEVGVCME